MKRLNRFVVGLLCLGLFVPIWSNANDKNDDKKDANKPQVLSDKDKKRRAKQTLKELDNAYKKWLNEEVVYIIMPEERTAFLQLSTNEERESYIEQFWLRRNPNPDTTENSFKEEHYRRIAYTNERFA